MLNTARIWEGYPLDEQMVKEYREKNYTKKFKKEVN